ncbi:MAG: SpoIID/LytB domain-containing protein [Phycisphaeraceae bacterium]
MAGLLLGVLAWGLAGCQPPSESREVETARRATVREGASAARYRLPEVGAVASEPTMRVRVQARVAEVALEGGEWVHFDRAEGDDSFDDHLSLGSPVTVTHDGEQFQLRTGSRGYAWRTSRLRVRTGFPPSGIGLNGDRYPGVLELVALAGRDGRPTGRFDVVNHVPMETYLPGVLERELFGSWDLDAFKAQAIAARSYALFERGLNADRHYDIQATTASQVYGGAASNPKAIEAARQTRGMVLTHDGRVVPGFYSSCCGGLTQTATSAFPRFGNTLAITPLRGGVACDYCRASPNYRWGPIEREADVLARRIAVWGELNDDPVAALEGLRSVRMTHRSPAGRPARFEVVDERGRRFMLPAEQFRFACNRMLVGEEGMGREMQLLSSHVRVSVQGDRVRFDDGRGFGHGAGMCQWGTQGMARAGYAGRAIVEHYYPDAEVRRVY